MYQEEAKRVRKEKYLRSNFISPDAIPLLVEGDTIKVMNKTSIL